jgi:hypothetical protein
VKSWKPLPVRRANKTNVPKANGKQRPLGIPTEPANCPVAQGSRGSGIVRHGHAPFPPSVGAAAAGAVRAEDP